MLDTKARHLIEKNVRNAAGFLVKKKVSANQLTITGLIIAVIGSTLYYLGFINYLLLLFLWTCGIIDVLDGKVANLTKKTPLGAFLDIVCDRIIEFAFIFVIASRINDYKYFFILFGVFFISISVFLTSAIINDSKTENKSFHYSPGITERTETFIFISLLIVFPSSFKIIILLFIILVIITIIQRTFEVYKFYGKSI